MTKKRKKLRSQINPEKSNKMIVAVIVGLVILFAVLLFVGVKSSSTPGDKGELMKRTLDYLGRSEGIAELKFYPEQNKVVIIYESYKEKKQNFQAIARFASIKLSNKMGKEELTVILAKDTENSGVRSFLLKDGRVIRESILSGP